jgi:hypothetical protein
MWYQRSDLDCFLSSHRKVVWTDVGNPCSTHKQQGSADIESRDDLPYAIVEPSAAPPQITTC